VALLIGSPAFADRPPPLEEAVAQAANENKPLVLEFGAEWCKPCRHFEQWVLPRADVKAALQGVVFVRYDIDEPPGNLIAKQLNVEGVPAFVVLDGAGKVIEQRSGAPVDSTAHVFFLELLMRAASSMPSLANLEAAVAASPDALTARMTLAHNYRAAGRITEAAELLDAVANHANASRELAAAAASERDAIVDGRARITDAVTRAETFVATYPDSPLSSFKLAVLGQSRRVTRERLDELAKAHLALVPVNHWPNAVRAALIVGADTAATDSIVAQLKQRTADASVHLVHAEAQLMHSDDRRDALAEIKQGCAERGHELWCHLLRERAFLGRGLPPGVAQLRDRAQGYLDALMDPTQRETDVGLDSVAELDEAFGNAVAIALAKARLECGYLATPYSHALVGLEVKTPGGKPSRVHAFSRDGSQVERCIQRVVGAASLPEAPAALHNHVHGSILFDTKGEDAAQFRKAPLLAGVMPQLVARRGAIETTGLRLDLLLGTPPAFARRSHASLIAGTTLEFAGADRGEPAYVARGHVGARTSFLGMRNVTTMLLVGLAVSDLGTEAPREYEVPIEARFRVDVGTVHFHFAYVMVPAWGPGDVHGYDSYAGGMTFQVAQRSVFLGGAYEQRDAGEVGMFTFGVPLGDFY
jgi:thiol-disulfide isomerase/thioredoxin